MLGCSRHLVVFDYLFTATSTIPISSSVIPTSTQDNQVGMIWESHLMTPIAITTAPNGSDDPGYYADRIDYLAKEAADRDKIKPILVCHSAGALIGLEYVKHHQQTLFEKVFLFNYPLLYPDSRVSIYLQMCYKGTENVNADTTLVMSTNDPILPMTLEWQGVTIADAIAEIRSRGKVKVQDSQAFEHSLFKYGVAWNLIAKLPTKPQMLRPRARTKKTLRGVFDLILRSLLRFLRKIFKTR
jgi:pimeloyl-ACP methyl ester carboxylesterase